MKMERLNYRIFKNFAEEGVVVGAGVSAPRPPQAGRSQALIGRGSA
jgi:hypothetical protein